MTLPITALFAGLLILWLVRLAVPVSRLRQLHKVSVGTGGFDDLDRAVRAHANFSEYIPMALVAMMLLEWQGLNDIYLYALGSSLLLGRILHRKGIVQGVMRFRALGMILTLLPLCLSALFLFTVWGVVVFR